ncbi:LuxR C-terminal-related transcriptional regulator [Actinocrispum sp. NPDC049592]|uniref:LuxR C-terminal-related transcriptional regulator n=1 Tax=Actinocrispum sp. NPDC049592 TaxID=3154835 RepID=UPI003421C7AF
MPEGLPVTSRFARWPLVDRSDELTDLLAALDDRARSGVLLCGPAGVGKTRLADEFLAVAEGSGRACGRATASDTAAQVPLGALAHLLPSEVGRNRCDAVALCNGVLGTFRLADQRPFVLLVDDLHLLDRTSLTLLTQLVDARAVFLIGTVRTGEPIPDAVSALWRGDRMVRIDLTELSFAGVEQLLCVVLGGPLEAGAKADLYAITRGNPLFLRELVLGALTAGRLVAERGVWRLTGPLVSTTPLTELVEAHIGTVEPAERSVLDLLAAVGHVGLSELTGMVPMDRLERLEHNGLVTVLTDGRRTEVRLAHPLYAEVLRSQLPVLTRRRLLLAHADRVQRAGARRPGDPLRIATWRLDADGVADPELLLAATRMARYGHDFAAVQRLATAALAQRDTAEGRLLLGEALYELGRFAEAETALAGAEPFAVDEQDLVPVIATRMRNLTWGLLDANEALRVSAAARERIGDRTGTQELLAIEARVQVYIGLPGTALRTLSLLGDEPEPRTAVLAAVPRAMALVLLGRNESGLAVARRGLADHTRLGDQLAMVHPSTHLVIEVQALTEAGRLVEAGERATHGHALAVRDRSAIARIWFAYHLGRCALLAGRPATAHRWYAEAVALCRDNNYPWPQRLMLSALATAAAVEGDAAGAQRALAEAADLPDIGYLRAEQELGPAWTAAATGDLVEARRILRAAADEAAASDQLSSEAWLRHDLVRLGDAGNVHNRLADLARQSEGTLVRAYAAHAKAAADDDPGRLTAASTRFEQLGVLLYAAEAALAAGRAYRRNGQARQATRSDNRAAALIETCQDAQTPGLLKPAAAVPLTRRESEIAVLAANGATSKEIAVTLHLSTRTVDNHLYSVYAKLGVTRRAELATALGTPH